MKAAKFYKAKEDLKIEDIVVPELQENEALVKIKACGICGTDIHIAIEGTIPPSYTPIVLGHEIAGVIEKINQVPTTNNQATNYQTGDRIIIYPQETCGVCTYCQQGKDSLCVKAKVLGLNKDGGLAEYIKIPLKNLIKLPKEISFEVGAIIADAVATPYHAITKRAKLKAGQSVAIFGCGGLGYHAIKICKTLGADKIIAVDINEEILNKAKNAGADEIINSKNNEVVQKIKNIIKGGVDISFEFIGFSSTIDLAIKSLKKGGKCLVCGIGMQKIETVPAFIFVGCEYELLGSFGSDKDDIKNILQLVIDKKLDLSSSVTEKFNLENINTALKKLHNKEGNPIRFVVDI